MKQLAQAQGEKRVISIIHPDNIRSRRVARKNGLWFERTRFFAGILYKFLPPTCKEKPGEAS
ncbi:hypothetical protein SAMN04488112_10953 [Melghirimyces thermohalophilus]|uniref:Acetyltransferase (GNAT) domain-containing protein n=1 Tax=Melghirimyces thermohalophilus TaxID=1236220 RepID=A0A1G6M7S5_9BACL|nr:hypothetical protein SAMN04488112_10953 [Melghirimyces thermohalophilus]